MKTAKSVNHLTKFIIVSSVLLWAMYTAIFLFIDGWHIEAISPVEIKFDKFTSTAFSVGLSLWLTSFLLVIDYKIFKNK